MFWLFVVLVVAVCVFFVVFYYRQTFGGDFSAASTDWSSFGSYIGGTLGPLVSFCTLLAVLQTVYMQRELLDAQKTEFRSINAHQLESLAAQEKQLDLANAESQRSEIQVYQNSQIKLIEMFIEHRLRVAESLEAQISSTKDAAVPIDQKMKALKSLQSRKVAANDAANSLLILAFEISVTQFSDVKEIKALLAEKLPKILNLNMPASES